MKHDYETCFGNLALLEDAMLRKPDNMFLTCTLVGGFRYL